MEIAITALTIIILMLVLKFIMQKRAQKLQGKQIDVSLFDDGIRELLNKKKSPSFIFTHQLAEFANRKHP